MFFFIPPDSSFYCFSDQMLLAHIQSKSPFFWRLGHVYLVSPSNLSSFLFASSFQLHLHLHHPFFCPARLHGSCDFNLVLSTCAVLSAYATTSQGACSSYAHRFSCQKNQGERMVDTLGMVKNAMDQTAWVRPKTGAAKCTICHNFFWISSPPKMLWWSNDPMSTMDH